MPFVTRTVFALSLAGFLTSCATRPVSDLDALGSVSATAMLSGQELAGIPQQGSLMDALQRLRPGWLQSRGATSSVVVDGGVATDLAYLRMIPVSTVREVRLERATSSVGRAIVAPNGDVLAGGNLIIVTTRRGGPI